MNETINQKSVEDIRQYIINAANETWQSYGVALMLARLGQDLARNGINLKTALNGEKLATFIERELKGNVKILSLPSDILVKGVVPDSASLTEDLAAYFMKPDVKPNSQLEKSITFDPNIWKAFSKAIPPNFIRSISLEPEIQFKDTVIAIEDTLALIISAEYIVSDSVLPKHDRTEKIYKNIVKWTQSNDIDINLVKARRVEKWGEVKHIDSLLSMLLNSLDNDDLQRISIPLDIISKLHNKKFKF
jgi:hypothetical protein